VTEKKTAWFDSVADYRAEDIALAVRRGLAEEQLDGLIKPGDRVLLKPNLVMAKTPEKAVTTHPAVVSGVAMVLKEAGARLYLGDSSGFGSFERCLAKSGLAPVLKRFAITPVDFTREKKVVHDPDNLVAKRLELAAAAFRFDHVVNLAKLKTHGMMGSTLALKNFFGFIVGLDKANWHLRAGHDRALFARIILDIHRQVRPAWNLIDGIVAMEGEGPTGGTPRRAGLLALGKEAAVLDWLVEEWAGFPGPTPLLVEARKLGLIDPEQIEARGPAADRPLRPRLKPAPGAEDATVPGQALWRRLFVRRPKISATRCHRCEVCINHCPARAMRLENDRVVIDYKKCINCYCCQELCPYGAVTIARRLAW
jgi:uncharacterized protein (DUF362 family)/Pyruvate/2-oxoacid:ferredoxin oxidoreductase delta subunit